MLQPSETTPGPLSPTAEATARIIEGGRAYLADITRRLAPYFAGSESRQRVMASLQGLLSAAERNNSWQLAEVCGEATPYGFQYVLNRADRDADAVRDELCRYVIQYLGDPNGVLVLDAPGFLKKGQHSAGVARQYSGTAGKVENCQIGVFLGYASPLGQVLLDRELYLPVTWTQDRERCRQAGLPEARGVATKPQLACQMLARAFAAGVPAPWVTGDCVYGDDRRLRLWLEARPQAYVLGSRARKLSGYVGSSDKSKRSWPACRWRAGAGSVLATGRKGRAGMTGTGCRWPSPQSPGGAAGSWSGAVSAPPRSCRRMWSLPHKPSRSRRSCGWRAAAGRSRVALRPPRERWAWITMKCAVGPAGIAICPSPCGPTPGWS
jgi:DDE superfamily endonuclease